MIRKCNGRARCIATEPASRRSKTLQKLEAMNEVFIGTHQEKQIRAGRNDEMKNHGIDGRSSIRVRILRSSVGGDHGCSAFNRSEITAPTLSMPILRAVNVATFSASFSRLSRRQYLTINIRHDRKSPRVALRTSHRGPNGLVSVEFLTQSIISKLGMVWRQYALQARQCLQNVRLYLNESVNLHVP